MIKTATAKRSIVSARRQKASPWGCRLIQKTMIKVVADGIGDGDEMTGCTCGERGKGRCRGEAEEYPRQASGQRQDKREAVPMERHALRSRVESIELIGGQRYEPKLLKRSRPCRQIGSRHADERLDDHRFRKEGISRYCEHHKSCDYGHPAQASAARENCGCHAQPGQESGMRRYARRQTKHQEQEIHRPQRAERSLDRAHNGLRSRFRQDLAQRLGLGDRRQCLLSASSAFISSSWLP